MNRMWKLLPELEGEEMRTVEYAIRDLSDEDAQSFAHVYRSRRKDPQLILILCIVGLFGIPGIQRFFVNQIGMGVLYFFTIGLCFIGSIVDLVNYKQLTQEYNVKVLSDILSIMRIEDKPATTN